MTERHALSSRCSYTLLQAYPLQVSNISPVSTNQAQQPVSPYLIFTGTPPANDVLLYPFYRRDNWDIVKVTCY